MRLNCEYLPATGPARQDMVLLHGWGSTPEIWRTLLAGLRPHANIYLLEVPGCAPCSPALPDDGQDALDRVLEAIFAHGPPQAVYVGWSLGGQLALQLAAHSPQRVAAVVTLASNPCFIGRTDWPGMPADDFHQFRELFAADAAAGLQRFNKLQVLGSATPRARLRELEEVGASSAGEGPQPGLRWLETLDQRLLLPVLTCPQLHILAAGDALVPVALASALEELLSEKTDAQVEVFEPGGHLMTLDDPQRVVTAMCSFLDGAGLWRARATPETAPDKRDIAQSFSRAAPVYDSVAQLQRDVGDRLLQRLDDLTCHPAVILDLGCGTGHFRNHLEPRFPEATYLGLDIAGGMVEYARAQGGERAQWLVADGEALPLAAASVDLVFSSLAIQWCYRPQLLFAELARVLRPGGFCLFTTLGPDTLHELRAAWAAVDSHQHVNRFLTADSLVEAADSTPGAALTLENAHFRMEYHRVRDLLSELKTLGAHNMNRNRPDGLTSRRSLQGMLQAYEQYREDGVLPATYDVILGTLERKWQTPGL